MSRISTQIRVIYDRKKEATKSTARDKKTAPVQIEVRHLGKRAYFSTGAKVYADQWRNDRVVGRADAPELQDIIDRFVKRTYEYISKCQDDGYTFSLDGLRDHMAADGRDGDFLAFLKRRIEERPIALKTRRAHMSVYRYLANDFRLIRRFTDLTRANLNQLSERLVRKGLAQTTINSYHQVLKYYCLEAYRVFNLIDTDPYDGYKLPLARSKERVALTESELRLLETYTPHRKKGNVYIDVEERARDMFLLQCYTGLAWADLAKFDFCEAEKNGGAWSIADQRQKTGSTFRIVLLPKAIEILRRWDMRMPLESYYTYNWALGKVEASCGIRKHLTTHVGRHTFATIALRSGVPIQIVSKILGHHSLSVTQIYTHLIDDDIKDAFNTINQKIG